MLQEIGTTKYKNRIDPEFQWPDSCLWKSTTSHMTGQISYLPQKKKLKLIYTCSASTGIVILKMGVRYKNRVTVWYSITILACNCYRFISDFRLWFEESAAGEGRGGWLDFKINFPDRNEDSNYRYPLKVASKNWSTPMKVKRRFLILKEWQAASTVYKPRTNWDQKR